MAEMDMGLAPKGPQKKKKKRKKESFFHSVVHGLIPCKGDSTPEVIRKVIFLAALVILVAALVYLAQYMLRYKQLDDETGGTNTATNAHLVELKNQQPTTQQIDQLPTGTVNQKYAALYAENNDFIGWLNIPGTNIDYPVMYTEEKDYYLHRNFNKEDEFSGTLFVDHRAKITPDSMPGNATIYGHNMLYKYQFSALNNYKYDIEFLKHSPVINFDTLYQNNKYKIISVFIVNWQSEHGKVFNYNGTVNFKNQSEFFNYVLECEDRSLYETGVDVQYGDEFLTLSTCDKSTAMDLRLVIVARKVRQNESPEVNTDRIKAKDSVKYFDAYYDIYGQLWQGRTWDTSVVKGLDDYIKENHLEDDPADYQSQGYYGY